MELIAGIMHPPNECPKQDAVLKKPGWAIASELKTL
jgi:hypothetical protein